MKKPNIVRYTKETLPKDENFDWSPFEALTDEDIEKAIAEDPDAVPILDNSFWHQARLVIPAQKASKKFSTNL